MTDLPERLAKALPYYQEGTSHEAELFYSVAWWRCRKCGVQWYGKDNAPDVCKPTPPAIDWPTVPGILAECKRRGWNVIWNIGTEGANMADIWMGSAYDSLAAGTTTDPVAALAEAFCRAVESTP